MNSQEKTFETIAKLKDIELELLRLRNALDMANKIIDAQTRPWVGLTDDDVCMILTQNLSSLLKREEEEKLQIIRQVNDFLMEKNSA
jgi:hypothetical protein